MPKHGRKIVAKIMKPRNTMSKGQRAMRDRSTRGSPPFSIPEFAKGFRAMPAMSKAMEKMGMATKPDVGAMKHREEVEKAMGLERGKK